MVAYCMTGKFPFTKYHSPWCHVNITDSGIYVTTPRKHWSSNNIGWFNHRRSMVQSKILFNGIGKRLYCITGSRQRFVMAKSIIYNLVLVDMSNFDKILTLNFLKFPVFLNSNICFNLFLIL